MTNEIADKMTSEIPNYEMTNWIKKWLTEINTKWQKNSLTKELNT